MIIKPFAFLFVIFISGVIGEKRNYYSFNEQAGEWLKLHQVPATWKDARVHCHSEGSDLAVPLTEQERDALKDYVSEVDQAISKIFVGLPDGISNDVYFTKNGVPLSNYITTRRCRGQIYHEGSENTAKSCNAMTTSGNATLENVKCNEKLPYVCMKRTQKPGCGPFDTGYKFDTRTDNCYKFHVMGKTWSDAYETCSTEGGYLAVVNSELESEVLKELYAKYPSYIISAQYTGDRAFIGVRDWRDGESWMTIEGTSLAQAGFDRWHAREPNNFDGHEHCITLNRMGDLFDENCDFSFAFICEKKPEYYNNEFNIYTLDDASSE